jgi:hypothetical protein
MYQFLRTKRVYVNQHKLWQITFWPAWPWYVNQHTKCQITFWPASVAWPRYIIDDMWSYYRSPLSGWLLFAVFICQFVADVGWIPLESVRNYTVCKSLHFNYPEQCILPQNETNYTCERLCILPQIVTNYMYTDVCTHRLFIPQVQPKWQWGVWGGCRCLLLML